MPQQTKIFRVFVSSTFSDMKVERKLLREKVFPVLEQFCRENGARFQAIDLRWGVSEESQRNQKTMEICLNEIRRCQQLSPRPNFLILLGDRYGWQPVPPAIPETEMDAIKKHLANEWKLIQEWYCLDENAVPAEYVLQPWGEHIKEYEEWEPIENRLRMALREAALKSSLSKDNLVKYTTSATHQEILAGTLNAPNDVADPESHVLAFSRLILNLPQDESAKDYIDLIQGKPDSYSRDMLKKMRKELEVKLKDHYVEYGVKWGKDGILMEDDQEFINLTITQLKSVIESELAKVVDDDEIKQETRYHEEFARTLSIHFTGREDSLNRIREYLNDTKNQKVLSLIGVSGSGKTSVMAKAVQVAEERSAVLVYRFIGANAKSSNLISLLNSLCGQIAQGYEINLESLLEESQKGQHLEINALAELLKKCIALAKPEKPLILFLDALDQLSDADNAKSLNWLPRELPPHTRIIVSCLPELEGVLKNTDVYHLPLMPKADGEKLLNIWLNVQGRKLTKAQKIEVLGKFNQNGLPLFMKIAVEQARKWHSYDPSTKLPDTVPDLIDQFFTGLETEHSKGLVSKIVGYILSGKDKGLTEDEIIEMLVFDHDYWQYFLKHSHPAHRREVEEAKSLPVVVWSRLFLDLSPYLTERDSFGERIIGFYHQHFNEILKKKYIKDEKPIHRKLGEYFSTRSHFFDGENQKKPNVRKCVEQPWQQTEGEMWDEVTATLCNLNFIQAKCASSMTYELVRDYQLAIDAIPERQAEKQKEKEHTEKVQKYINDLIAYAKGEIKKLNIIQSVECWSEERIKKEIKRIKINSTRVDRLKEFLNFLGQESDNLQRYAHQFPNCAIQQAWNYSDSGPVGYAVPEMVKKKTSAELDRLLLRSTRTRPERNPLPQALKTLKGHTYAVNAVCMTPDGKRAVSGSDDQTCILWDLETGRALKTLTGHTGTVNAVSVTPDGRRAVSGSYDKTCILWDLDTGRALKTLNGHIGAVSAVSVTPDGRRAVSGSEDGICVFWDLDSGLVLKTLIGHANKIQTVYVNSDGKHAVVVSGPKDLICMHWDLETGQVLRTLKMKMSDVSIIPDGKHVVCWETSGIILWDLESGKAFKKSLGFTGFISTLPGVSATPDGKYVVVLGGYSFHKDLILWDLENGKALKTLRGHVNKVKAVSVTPDGKRAISGSDDKTCILWDLECGQEKILKEHTQEITTLNVIPNGKRAVSGSWDYTCILWDIETGKALKTLRGHGAIVDAVSITPDGKRAVSGSADKTCILWDLKRGKALRRFIGHYDPVSAVSVTPDGKRVLSVSNPIENSCILWELENDQVIQRFIEHFDLIYAVRVAPDGKRTYSNIDAKDWGYKIDQAKRLWGHTDRISSVSITLDGKHAVTSSLDNTSILWDLESGLRLKTFKRNFMMDSPLSLTPDGKCAISGSYHEDETYIIWDLEKGQVLKTISEQKVSIWTMIVSPDGKRAVSYSADTCNLWDIKSGKALKTLTGHIGHVISLNITPDGKRAVSISKDNTLILWNLENGKMLARFIGSFGLYVTSVFPKGIIVGGEGGKIVFLSVRRELLCPGPGIVTVRYIWEFRKHQYSGPYTDCPFCGKRFEPQKKMIETIRGILRNGNIGPNDSPCLKLPKEAWEEPGLLSKCPKCGEAIKFNPFIVEPT